MSVAAISIGRVSMLARHEVRRQEQQREEDQAGGVRRRRAARLERDELHEADEHDRPQRGQADQQHEAEHAAGDRDAEDQPEDHHQRSAISSALRDLGDEPPEHDRRARHRRRAQLVEVAALDLLDEEQRGGAERRRQQQRARQLEGAVALPVEELRRGRREDLRRLADVDDQEEQRDEQRRQQRLRRPPPLAQRALAEHQASLMPSPPARRRRRGCASGRSRRGTRRRAWVAGRGRARSRSSAFRLAGVPSRTISPPSMIASRSQSASASSRYCVVRNTVVPRSLIRRTSSQTVSRLDGSSPVVGSSRNSTSGWCTSADARSSRRFMPPE